MNITKTGGDWGFYSLTLSCQLEGKEIKSETLHTIPKLIGWIGYQLGICGKIHGDADAEIYYTVDKTLLDSWRSRLGIDPDDSEIFSVALRSVNEFNWKKTSELHPNMVQSWEGEKIEAYKDFSKLALENKKMFLNDLTKQITEFSKKNNCTEKEARVSFLILARELELDYNSIVTFARENGDSKWLAAESMIENRVSSVMIKKSLQPEQVEKPQSKSPPSEKKYTITTEEIIHFITVYLPNTNLAAYKTLPQKMYLTDDQSVKDTLRNLDKAQNKEDFLNKAALELVKTNKCDNVSQARAILLIAADGKAFQYVEDLSDYWKRVADFILEKGQSRKEKAPVKGEAVPKLPSEVANDLVYNKSHHWTTIYVTKINGNLACDGCTNWKKLSDIEITGSLSQKNCRSLTTLENLNVRQNALIVNCSVLQTIKGKINGNFKVKNCPELKSLEVEVNGDIELDLTGNQTIDKEDLYKKLLVFKTSNSIRRVIVKGIKFTSAQVATLMAEGISVR